MFCMSAKKKMMLWQLAAGVVFIVAQFVALMEKKTGPVIYWVMDMARNDPWKAFKFFSLGLVGIVIILYAFLEYRYAKGLPFLRVVSVLLGVVLVWRQLFELVTDMKASLLPWQMGGAPEQIIGRALAYFSTGIMGVLCICLAFLRKQNIQPSGYFKASFSALHCTRLLVFAALMIAMARALSIVPGIPIAHTKLTFGFLARALCAMVCGPVLGLVYGFVEDILGFILQPTGEFFFGYTISTMAGVLVYAVFFYRRKVTVLSIVLANLVVNVVVNALLGSVWTMMTRGGGYWGWFVPSLIKNMITIIPKSAMLYFLFRAMLPILQRMGVISKSVGDKVGWLS